MDVEWYGMMAYMELRMWNDDVFEPTKTHFAWRTLSTESWYEESSLMILHCLLVRASNPHVKNVKGTRRSDGQDFLRFQTFAVLTHPNNHINLITKFQADQFCVGINVRFHSTPLFLPEILSAFRFVPGEKASLKALGWNPAEVIAVEHGHWEWVFPLEMVIFNSYVYRCLFFWRNRSLSWI